MFNIAIPIIPIGFIADTFYIDRFCSDRFHTDMFCLRTQFFGLFRFVSVVSVKYLNNRNKRTCYETK